MWRVEWHGMTYRMSHLTEGSRLVWSRVRLDIALICHGDGMFWCGVGRGFWYFRTKSVHSVSGAAWAMAQIFLCLMLLFGATCTRFRLSGGPRYGADAGHDGGSRRLSGKLLEFPGKEVRDSEGPAICRLRLFPAVAGHVRRAGQRVRGIPMALQLHRLPVKASSVDPCR